MALETLFPTTLTAGVACLFWLFAGRGCLGDTKKEAETARPPAREAEASLDPVPLSGHNQESGAAR